MSESLANRVDELTGRKVLVVGDIGLDEYLTGEVRRISPEAPVPIVQVLQQNHALGMSAFVAANIVSLGAEPILLSVIGKDESGDAIGRLLEENGVDSQYLITDSERPTTRKTRILAQDHHIVRVDHEMTHFLSEECHTRLVERLEDLVSKADAIVLQDYAKGVISKSLVARAAELGRRDGKPVMVDPHRVSPIETYSGVSLIKPNFEESLALVGVSIDEIRRGTRKIEDVARQIVESTGADQLVLTRGKDGMLAYDKGHSFQVPTYSREVFDVTGAGDAVIATLSMALAAGWSLEDGCRLANYAAGVVVGKIGCVPCRREELTAYIRSHAV